LALEKRAISEPEDRQLTDTLGKPLKGILKNNQFQSLPRSGPTCGLCRNNSSFDIGKYDSKQYYSQHQFCDPSERLSKDEVLDTVESSV